MPSFFSKNLREKLFLVSLLPAILESPTITMGYLFSAVFSFYTRIVGHPVYVFSDRAGRVIAQVAFFFFRTCMFG